MCERNWLWCRTARSIATILGMASATDKKRLTQLRETVAHHQKRYHEQDAPEISDEAYDALVEELQKLELLVEGKVSKVATAVGGAVSEAFAKVTHKARQWSFDNVFDEGELVEWEARVARLLGMRTRKKIQAMFVSTKSTASSS